MSTARASARPDELVRRIQASIRAAAVRGRDQERIGPFLATFNRDDANPYLNYAIPDDHAEPSVGDVETLVGAYRARRRRPRLEYLPSLAPAVEPALGRVGFAVERRTPLMTCGGASAVCRLAVDGVELVAPASDEEYRAAAQVQWAAYDEPGDVPRRAVDALRWTAGAGGIVVLARDAATGAAGRRRALHRAGGWAHRADVGGSREPLPPARHRRGDGGMARGARPRRRGERCLPDGARGAGGPDLRARAGFTHRGEVLHISRE